MIHFTITEMFKRAYQDLDKPGRHSPDKNFMEELEAWCAKTGHDYLRWKQSMYRLFYLKNHFPAVNPALIVSFVIRRDKEKLCILNNN